VVQPERQHHLFRSPILRFFPDRSPIRIRSQALVQIATVIVNQVIAAIHDFFRYEVQRPIRLRPIRFPRIKPVHALVVHRIHVGNLLFERSNIDQWHQNHRAGYLRRIQLADQFLDRDDRDILCTVRTGHLRSVHHHHWNIGARIHSRGQLNVPIRLLVGPVLALVRLLENSREENTLCRGMLGHESLRIGLKNCVDNSFLP
jgi:hypothetical protein